MSPVLHPEEIWDNIFSWGSGLRSSIPDLYHFPYFWLLFLAVEYVLLRNCLLEKFMRQQQSSFSLYFLEHFLGAHNI